MQHLGHAYTKKLFTAYLKLKCNWASSCIVAAEFGNPCPYPLYSSTLLVMENTGCLCLVTIANENTTKVPICSYKGAGKYKVYFPND